MKIQLIDKIMPVKTAPILVGVSMGVDSLAALIYLRNRGYNVIPAHHNHCLRQQNFDMQKKFLEFVKEFGFPIFITNDVTLSDMRGGLSEAQCRSNRIEFFKESCALVNSSFVVTAHHLDDCVESYLLNCFRGQPEFQPIKIASSFGGFSILHPFLLNPKKSLEQYVDGCYNGNLSKFIVVDETNSVIKGSRRNWIRHEIVPAMERQSISLKKFCSQKILEQINK